MGVGTLPVADRMGRIRGRDWVYGASHPSVALTSLDVLDNGVWP
jgi:hypothetical protein